MRDMTCSLCSSPVFARGWCSRHWTRWRRHGDPLFVRPDAIRLTPYEKVMRSVFWDGDCLIFNRSLSHGYGHTTYYKVRHKASRVMMEHHHGPIPDGMYVLHSCDRRACVNIDHLRLGTHQENMDDRRKRGGWRADPQLDPGRARSGGPLSHPKLTVEQVLAIRSDTRTQRVIAAEYGMSQSGINAVINGKTYYS